jgi:hypothetical protein
MRDRGRGGGGECREDHQIAEVCVCAIVRHRYKRDSKKKEYFFPSVGKQKALREKTRESVCYYYYNPPSRVPPQVIR